MYAAMLVLTGIALLIGLLLAIAAQYLKPPPDETAEAIERALPGTNCGQCGLPGCSVGAQAAAAGELPVDFCPPGGRMVAEEIARITGRPLPIGEQDDGTRWVAQVTREDRCTGCLKCIKACPTDAVIGAPKQIHGVLPEACSGCAACLEVCETGAIELVPEPRTLANWRWPRPQEAFDRAA
ncbi:MAG: RnfABCDGE type electron transport complex subunit B [Halorhodospira sp.]